MIQIASVPDAMKRTHLSELTGIPYLNRLVLLFCYLVIQIASVPDAMKRTHLSGLTGIPYLNRLVLLCFKTLQSLGVASSREA